MKLTKIIPWLLLIFVLAVTIASCQSNPSYTRGDALHATNSIHTDCRDIEHLRGTTKICGQPQKIVVLGVYMLEALLALDIQPVAFGDNVAFQQGDFTNPSQQIPYLGERITQPIANVGSAYSPSIEAIMKVQPDLILGTEFNTRQYQTFSRIAPTLILKYPDPEGNLKAIAQAVNRNEQAEQILKDYKVQIATMRQEFASVVASNPKLLLLSSGELRDIYLVTNRTGICRSLLQDLGFQLVSPPNFPENPQSHLVPISLETLPQLDQADLAILLGNNFTKPHQFKQANNFGDAQLTNLKQAWSKNAIAQSLNVSKSGKVYFIPTYLCLGLPGPIGTDLYLNELKKQILPTK